MHVNTVTEHVVVNVLELTSIWLLWLWCFFLYNVFLFSLFYCFLPTVSLQIIYNRYAVSLLYSSWGSHGNKEKHQMFPQKHYCFLLYKFGCALLSSESFFLLTLMKFFWLFNLEFEAVWLTHRIMTSEYTPSCMWHDPIASFSCSEPDMNIGFGVTSRDQIERMWN